MSDPRGAGGPPDLSSNRWRRDGRAGLAALEDLEDLEALEAVALLSALFLAAASLLLRDRPVKAVSKDLAMVNSLSCMMESKDDFG